MSTENVPPETPPKKKGGKLKPVLFSVLLLAAGGGGTYAAFASGMLGAHGAQEEDNNPKLVRKGDEDPYPFAGGGEAKDCDAKFCCAVPSCSATARRSDVR